MIHLFHKQLKDKIKMLGDMKNNPLSDQNTIARMKNELQGVNLYDLSREEIDIICN